MKKMFILAVFLLAPSIGACHSLGGKYLAGDQISVSLSKQYVHEDPRNARNFRKHKGVERLYRRLLDKLDRYRIRRSLKFDVLITDYYIGPGRDRLVADVIVTERGEEVDQFVIEESTGLHPIVKRLTRGMAKKITKRARAM